MQNGKGYARSSDPGLCRRNLLGKSRDLAERRFEATVTAREMARHEVASVLPSIGRAFNPIWTP